MKILAILFFATATPLLAQTTGISLPSGFTAFTISGTGGSVSSKLSVNALSVTPDVLWQSASTTAVTASGTTLTDSTATWTDSLYNGANGTHYLEVISVGGSASATGVGTTYTISATTAASKTITLASSFATGVSGTVGYRVRKYWTITSVFGAANTAGLQGGTALTADQVLLWNGAGYDTYYYQTAGLGGTGWRKVGAAQTDASGTLIYPTVPVLIKRGQSASLTLTGTSAITGAFKGGITTASIAAGYSVLANPYGVNMTLASSGLYTGSSTTGLAPGTSTTGDQVLIYNSTTNAWDAYYYLTSTGWRKTTDAATDASTTALATGAGFIIKRGTSGTFTWSMPQHPTSL